MSQYFAMMPKKAARAIAASSSAGLRLGTMDWAMPARFDDRRRLERVVRRRRRQVRPLQRIGAFPGLLRRRLAASQALEEEVDEHELREREAERAEGGNLVPGLEHERIVGNAPRHAGEAQEVLHEEDHVEE